LPSGGGRVIAGLPRPVLETPKMRPTLAALLLLALPFAAPAASQDVRPRVTVIGEGRVDAAPDLATFTAGVQTEATRAEEAFAATSAAMRAVFEALAAAGIAPEDMQTSQLSLDALWADDQGQGQPRLRGYSASNLVTIRVRDIERLGPVIDAVGAAGANRVYGVTFAIADPKAATDEARRLAVADARAQAELLAEAAGVTLGPVLSIREPGGEAPGPMFARAEMAMDTPVAAGEVSVGARVEIVYAIE
jgi:uncharacterized protein YggE